MEFKLKSEYNFHLKKHKVINQNNLNNNNIIKNQQSFNLVVNNIQNFPQENHYLNFVTNLYYKKFLDFKLENIMNNKTFGNNINENNVIENNNNNKIKDFYDVNNNFKYEFNFIYNVHKKKFKNLIIIKEINYNIFCV